MGVNRRTLLKTLAAAGATAALKPAKALAAKPVEAPPNAVGLLYDATLCIGCKACMTACRKASGLDATSGKDDLWDDPIDLSAKTKNIIKYYKADGQSSFVKMQCMHCVDPACASVCMLGALKKREFGLVTYDENLCVGCRYCELACPFNVPKFQWDSATPRIVKCELCNDRIADGKLPACVEVCPREAVIFGKRTELLQEAHRRIEAEPERYNPRVYGEVEGGGTQVLYLSAANIPFEKLGLPALGEASVPSLPRTIQHAIYKGFAAPAAAYIALGAVVLSNLQERSRDDEEDE